MKAFALTTLALLGVASSAQTHRLKQTLAQIALPLDTATHTCSQAVTRLNSEANFDFQSVITAGQPWTDPSFGGSSSIYWQDFNGLTVSSKISQIDWARARTRNPSASLFGPNNNPIIKDIHQGALGDCYYLSSISAVAEWPDRIKAAFLTQTYNNAGIFALKVYVRGKPTTVVIDDFLPFLGTTGNSLIFDRVFAGEGIWAALLEKAWAKTSGNYDVTTSGNMVEAVGFLTGAPSTTWKTADAATINNNGLTAWNIINAADASQLIMNAGVGSTGCDALGKNAYGLACRHAYSLIGSYAIKDAAGTVTNRLMLLRNPWGVDAGYNGAWNDGDTTRWTAEAKAQVPYVNDLNDGSFFMEAADFVKSFSTFVISYYRPGWANTIVDVTNDVAAPQRTWSFTLDRAQEVFVGMEFYNARMYAKGCKATTTGIMYLQSATSYLGGFYTYDWNGFNKFHFESLAAGTYTFKFQPTWNAQDVKDYTVRLYTATPYALRAL